MYVFCSLSLSFQTEDVTTLLFLQIDYICLSRVCSETVGGLPGCCLFLSLCLLVPIDSLKLLNLCLVQLSRTMESLVESIKEQALHF